LRGTAALFVVPVPGHRLASSMIMLVRYRESPVGPYDELLWCRKRRVAGGKAWSVDPIVVDSADSVAGGRDNWGFPKDLARFSVAESGSRISATVFGDDGRVFADIAYQARGLEVPVGSRLVPPGFTELVQERAGRVFRTRPKVKGRLRRLRVDRFDLAAPFPKLIKTDLRTAVGLSDFELDFPPAEVTSS
jgi:hypothetical protein